jgi:YD repeat-containing protein
MAGTRYAVIGIGTGSGGVEIGCGHELYVGGYSIQEKDPYPPSISVSGVPSGWFDPAKVGGVLVGATDTGLGVHWLSMEEIGGGSVHDQFLSCNGANGSRCPRERGWAVAPPYKNGERTLQVTAEDPVENVGKWTTTTKVDSVKPEISLGGQLAYATEEEGLKGEENEASENQLSLPVYNVHIEATDGSNDTLQEKQSGVKNIEILLDGVKQTVSWKAQECPGSSCKMGEPYQLKLVGLIAGEHKLKVIAEDQVGLKREREIEFEYIPATGMKDEYVMQRFPLPDGQGDEAAEEHPNRPELAVNVMNGNLVYRQKDVEVTGPAVDLEVERFYNSQLPEEDNTEWGDGWILAQTPTLEPEETNEEAAPAEAAMVRTSGVLESAVGLPTESGGERFDTKLHAVVSKEADGGYAVADQSGESDNTLAFNEVGKVTEMRTQGSATLNYSYEGGELSEIAVDDSATAGGVAASEVEEPLASHIYSQEFGNTGTGAGQLSGPQGLATDPEGNVWVADSFNNRIQEFTAEGEFVRKFGAMGSGNGQLNRPGGIAIDPEGNVWVADTFNHRIQKFNSKGEYILGFSLEGPEEGRPYYPQDIAIDSKGNLWVTDSNNHGIQKFNSKGEYLTRFGSSGTGNGQLSGPHGIAIDAAGNIWIADSGNNRVQEFNSNGGFIRKFGVKGSGEGQLSELQDIAVDSNGNIWATDRGNNRVQEFSVTGEYLSQFGIAGDNNGQFFHPCGIATDSKGNLWIADTGNDRVQEIATGEYVRQFGGESSGAGHLKAPQGISTDKEGNVWVADTSHNRIQEFNSKGEFVLQFGAEGVGNGQFQFPEDLAVDSAGNVWVSDSSNNRIQKFNSKGEYIRQLGSYGTGNGQFNFPQGIAIDSEGNIWAVDAANNRVQKFNSKGEYLTKFGSSGTGNGQFNFPQGIAINSEGNIWIADSGNNRVQKFNSKGEYLTKFGTSGSGEGQLSKPNAIAIDSEGNVWVADTNNNRIEEFSAAGAYLSQIGTEGEDSSQFLEPRGIATDSKGNLWIADTGNDRVQELVAGEYVLQFGAEASTPDQLSTPNAVATDSIGNIWVADTGHNRIKEFNPEGRYLGAFGVKGSGDGQLWGPRGLAVDSKDRIYVADSSNNRIQEFSSKGEYIRKWGTNGTGNGQFRSLEGVAVDPEGRVWTLEAGKGPRVQEFSAEGTYLTKFGGTEGSANGQFKSPQGIRTDAEGHVWIADSGNNRVQGFQPSGEFVRKFGSAGSANGQFSSPRGIAIDPEGKIWVTDSGNDRVQEFSVTGEYLSQFGVAGDNDGQLSEPRGLAVDASDNIWAADTGNDRVQERSHVEPPPVESDPSVEVDVSNGLVTSVEGEEAGQTTYSHASDLLTAADGPEGETKYQYDGAGRLTKVQLPNGTWGEIAYEAIGRVKSVTVSVEGGKAKATQFTYSDEPRETVATFETDPAVRYQIGADGSVLKWWNAKVPPEIEELTGSLYTERGEVHPEPISSGDQTLNVKAHAWEGIASIQIVANGNQMVTEKTCEESKCVNLEKELVTETQNWPPGILQFEVIVTDTLNQTTSERFWDNIPYTPPPEPEALEPPKFDQILRFREEFGLDLDLKGDETAINERIFELIAAWHDPTAPAGEVARASSERWSVPLRPVDIAELEYRQRYLDQAASVIPAWGEQDAPGAYAGYYVDHRAGGVIHVGFTKSAAENLSRLSQESGFIAPGRLALFSVAPQHPYSQLESVQASIAGHSSVLPSFTQVRINVAHNVVEVGTTSSVQAMESALTSLLGPGVPAASFVDSSPPSGNTGRKRLVGRVRAGDRIIPPKFEYCTAAFGAWQASTDSRGGAIYKHFLLTAAHCAEGIGEQWTREARNPNTGEIDYEVLGKVRRVGTDSGNQVDGEAILLQGEAQGWSPRQIYLTPNSSQPVTGVVAPTTGMMVCTSGVTTDEVKCGPVEGPAIFLTYTNAPIGTWEVPIGIWEKPGDSGSPVWQMGTGNAVGLWNAGRLPSYVSPLLPIPTLQEQNASVLDVLGFAPGNLSFAR